MFEKATPEEVGISSASVKKYIDLLERYRLSTHDVLMIRHGKIFCEAYWKPFHPEFLHRMYSVTKSFVGIAIGFLEQDGLIDLDAPVSKYLTSEICEDAFESVKNQTIRNMLMMASGYTHSKAYWFDEKPADRLRNYFETANKDFGTEKIPGTIFEYDSPGTFVLGAIIERITGKTFLDYLRGKVLDRIGFSKNAAILKCPGGHSWSDSSLLCTPLDIAKTLIFLMNGGKWDGEQLLNEDYVRAATGNQISTNETGNWDSSSYGYGYQIWRSADNSFSFNGMGCQFGIAVPDKDLVFVINSDNQGSGFAKNLIFDRFFEEIAETACDEPLPENPEAYKALEDRIHYLELYSLSGSVSETVKDRIGGKEFEMQDNPMGITRMKFDFSDDDCTLSYTNAQGDKVLHFGLDKNIFGVFPQEGYSDQVGTVYAPDHYYKCAASAAWTHKNSLQILVQIIDRYFGRLFMRVDFTDDDRISVCMFKVAEDFLREYTGYAQGKLK